jgi:hypothetical protein
MEEVEKEEDIAILPCKHPFHKRCILVWKTVRENNYLKV